MEVVRRVDGALDLKSLHDLDHHGGGERPGKRNDLLLRALQRANMRRWAEAIKAAVAHGLE